MHFEIGESGKRSEEFGLLRNRKGNGLQLLLASRCRGKFHVLVLGYLSYFKQICNW
jgi:hypothetical protein